MIAKTNQENHSYIKSRAPFVTKALIAKYVVKLVSEFVGFESFYYDITYLSLDCDLGNIMCSAFSYMRYNYRNHF
jgi:hypothetical protein